MDTKELEGKLGSIETELMKFIEKHAEEMKLHGAASTETKSALEKLSARNSPKSKTAFWPSSKSHGTPRRRLRGSEVGWRSRHRVRRVQKREERRRTNRQDSVGAIHEKTNVVNASGQNQPLVPAFRRPGIQGPGLAPFTVRDLLPSTPIASNLVEYAKETVFTNAAAIQANEGDAKAESALTFTLSLLASSNLGALDSGISQLLEDAPAIQGYINNRLMYGLKLKEEDELLNGSGVGTELSGLITNPRPTTRAITTRLTPSSTCSCTPKRRFSCRTSSRTS
jgi:HK97 family phage major capsid protein